MESPHEIPFSLSIDLTPVPNAEQMEDPVLAVEFVNDAVVADAQPKRIDSLHAMMCVRIERATEAVNAGFDSRLKIGRKLEKIGVEVAGKDL